MTGDPEMSPARTIVINPHASRRSLFSRFPFVSVLSDFPCIDEISLMPPPASIIIEVQEQDAASKAIKFVHEYRAYSVDTCIILIVTNSTEELAIAALNAGVSRYLKAPVEEEVLASLLVSRGCPSSVASGAQTLLGGDRLIGHGAHMEALRSAIGRAARCMSNVLITGETGTGKELVAELIHENSARANGPFVTLNSTAIPESLIESELFGYERGAFTGANATHQGKLVFANRGTIFLDEIGDIGVSVQTKLLRALDGKQIYPLGSTRPVSIDVRVVAATNHDLEASIQNARFRQDLYYRLNVVRFKLPPLRERLEDIPELVNYYISVFNRLFGVHVEGLTQRALDALALHNWPGNIRELRNVMEVIFVNLPPDAARHVDLPLEVRQYVAQSPADSSVGERDRLLTALIYTRWNKTKAAERLHWSRMTLYRKMMQYRIPHSDKAGLGLPSALPAKTLAAYDQTRDSIHE
jgi:DNA-binding NtrC family response regulator